MDNHGIARTSDTYGLAIDALKTRHARCEELFNEMRSCNITPSHTAYNAMLWIYCAERRVADAFYLFEEMKANKYLL